MAGCILGTSSVAVNAQENEKIVDGSVLTTDDTSTGRTENGLERGIHLMDGECSISKAGISRVYCYGSTTANHEVSHMYRDIIKIQMTGGRLTGLWNRKKMTISCMQQNRLL